MGQDYVDGGAQKRRKAKAKKPSSKKPASRKPSSKKPASRKPVKRSAAGPLADKPVVELRTLARKCHAKQTNPDGSTKNKKQLIASIQKAK